VPPGSTAFSTTFSQDTTATVEMTACNITVCKSGAVPVVVKFTSPTPTPSATPVPGTPTPIPTAAPVGPPATVNVQWTASHGGAGSQIDCFTQFAEDYNTITWEATNASPASQASGAKSFTTFRSAAGEVAIKATVCLNANCTVSNTVYLVAGAEPLQSGLAIVDPGEVCVPPGTFNVVAYFGGWNSGDPLPTGLLTFSNPTWMPSTFQLSVSPAVFNGKPGAIVSEYYFESYAQPEMEISVSYSGDATWPADSAGIVAVPVFCGEP
jgi:hypothetical protein